MHLKLFLTLFLLCIVSSAAFAQQTKNDTIYLLGKKKPIQAKVLEVNSTEVKIKNLSSDVIRTYSRYEVDKIVYADGSSEKMDRSDMLSLEYFPENKLNAFKIAPLPILTGNLALYWERIMKPGISWEAEATVIGISKDNSTFNYYPDSFNVTARGLSLGIGYKAMRLPNQKSGKLFLRSLFQGSYIKPKASIYFANQPVVKQKFNNNTGQVDFSLEKTTVFGANMGVDFGRQWALADRFVLDLSFGAGIWFDNLNKRLQQIQDDTGINPGFIDYGINSRYGFTRIGGNLDQNMGLSISGNIKLGYCFDLKRDRERKAPK
jgi:hypothetical protein